MRNSKVRQRIAAGKLKLRIRDLRNLGVKSEQVLGALGIYTADALRHQGAVRVYAELKRSGGAPSLNLLWALAGALEPWPEGTHWREIARGDTRLSLLLAVEDLEAGAAASRASKGLTPLVRPSVKPRIKRSARSRAAT